jgi:hypothetical protein
MCQSHLQFIDHHPILAELELKCRCCLAMRLVPKAIPAGEVVATSGPCFGFTFLVTGSVLCMGKELARKYSGPGLVIGLDAHLESGRNTFSFRAYTDTTVLQLLPADLVEGLEQFPKSAQRMRRAIMKRAFVRDVRWALTKLNPTQLPEEDTPSEGRECAGCLTDALRAQSMLLYKERQLRQCLEQSAELAEKAARQFQLCAEFIERLRLHPKDCTEEERAAAARLDVACALSAPEPVVTAESYRAWYLSPLSKLSQRASRHPVVVTPPRPTEVAPAHRGAGAGGSSAAGALEAPTGGDSERLEMIRRTKDILDAQRRINATLEGLASVEDEYVGQRELLPYALAV